MIIKDHIALFENVVGDAYCKQAIDWFEHKAKDTLHEKVNNDLGDNPDDFRDDYSISNPFRYSSFMEIDNGSLKKLLKKSYDSYRKSYNLGGSYPLTLPENYILPYYKIQKAEPGGGFCSWHCEFNQTVHAKRYLVWMLYLNDVEQGGKTEFLSGQKIKPKRGRLVLWPAYFTHIHRAAPDLKENKYILTGWFEYIT
jgi:hypothetical protein